MTVKELREALKAYRDEAIVHVALDDGSVDPITITNKPDVGIEDVSGEFFHPVLLPETEKNKA